MNVPSARYRARPWRGLKGEDPMVFVFKLHLLYKAEIGKAHTVLCYEVEFIKCYIKFISKVSGEGSDSKITFYRM